MAKYVPVSGNTIDAYQIKLTREVNSDGDEIITNNLGKIVEEICKGARWPHLVSYTLSISKDVHGYLNISELASNTNKHERLPVFDGDYIVARGNGPFEKVAVVMKEAFENAFVKAPDNSAAPADPNAQTPATPDPNAPVVPDPNAPTVPTP